MSGLFIDSSFYIALVSEVDRWHKDALEIDYSLSNNNSLRLVTSNAVLTEFLAFFSRKLGFRKAASEAVEQLILEKRITTFELTNEAFLSALSLYHSRLDKRYSLVDCFSMDIMNKLNIRHIVSYDGDFSQEGFTLVREQSELPLHL